MLELGTIGGVNLRLNDMGKRRVVPDTPGARTFILDFTNSR